jgi:hypothetical protein
LRCSFFQMLKMCLGGRDLGRDALQGQRVLERPHRARDEALAVLAALVQHRATRL